MMTDEHMAVSLDHGSSDEIAKKIIFNYLNIIQSSNNCCLMKYWYFCFTEFSKLKYVC